MRALITPREQIWPAVTDEQIQRLQAAGFDEVIVATDRETQLDAMRTVDVLIGAINEEMLEHAGQLRWMQSLSSGVDEYLFPAFVESDIVLTSEKGLVGDHLADHAFGLLFALTRSIVWAARERSWENRMKMRRANRELTGLTAGIIGLGGTGMAVARRGHACGMQLLAIDSDVTSSPEYVELLGGPDKLLDMAARCDVLFVCCPKTAETTNMVDAAALSAMPPGGYVVNVTRGGIIDEDALMAAIDRGHLYGAGLDVTAKEPLPSSSPLWSYDRIIITPHIAGASQHRIGRIIERVCNNIQHLKAGEDLEGVVDKRKGY